MRHSFWQRARARLVLAAAVGGLSLFSAAASAATYTAADATGFTSLLGTVVGGDEIVLLNTQTYTGSFTLQNRPGTGYITIRSNQMASLPGPGVRVNPTTHAQYMPKIVSSGGNSKAVKTALGAHNYKLIGLEIMKGTGEAQLDVLIQLGDGTTNTAVGMPYDITFDRCYVHGRIDQVQYTKTGFRLDCADARIINCHISNIYSLSQQAVGIGGINGAGPWLIDNNYISASGENIIFGGGAGFISGLVPSSIQITRNYLWKDPSWSATLMTCNHFELKLGKFVNFQQNLIENNWSGQGQDGVAIALKVANVNASPWFVTEDVTVANNIASNIGQGFMIQGDDPDHGHTGNVQRLWIRNNLMYGVKTTNGSGHAFYSCHGPTDVIYDHNTIINNGTKYMNLDVLSEPSNGVRYMNNLTGHGAYGIFGSGTGTGDPSINGYFPGCVWLKNVMVNFTGATGLTTAYAGHTGNWSPASNAFPAAWTNVVTDSVNPGTNYVNFKVKTGTVYKGVATTASGTVDGTDIGADINSLVTATAGCVSGTWAAANNTPIEDFFPYTGNLIGNKGGWGWIPNVWTQYQTFAGPATGTGSLGYTDSAGNILEVHGNMLAPAVNNKAYRNIPTERQFVPVNGDVLWVSFRINHTGTGALPSNHAGFALYSSLDVDASGDEFFMGNPGFSGQNWGFNPEGGTRVVAPGTVQTGAPRNVLLVYKLAYGATNAAVSMWINPVMTSEAGLGTPQATGTQPGLDPVRSVIISTGGTSTGYQLDELRIGRTFSSVTPH